MKILQKFAYEYHYFGKKRQFKKCWRKPHMTHFSGFLIQIITRAAVFSSCPNNPGV